jgi:hypothetical protein
MPWFEIVYSEDPAGKALTSSQVVARNRAEAATVAEKGFPNAKSTHGATCFRITDGLGMVVARGPKAS